MNVFYVGLFLLTPERILICLDDFIKKIILQLRARISTSLKVGAPIQHSMFPQKLYTLTGARTFHYTHITDICHGLFYLTDVW